MSLHRLYQENTAHLPAIQGAALLHTQEANIPAAATSVSSCQRLTAARGKGKAITTANNSHLLLVPTAQGTHSEQGAGTDAESLSVVAPKDTTEEVSSPVESLQSVSCSQAAVFSVGKSP